MIQRLSPRPTHIAGRATTTSWRYIGHEGTLHVWEGPCVTCGHPAVVYASGTEVSHVKAELDEFGGLECQACRSDRLHELTHIVRSESRVEYLRIVAAVPEWGFRGDEEEHAYRQWCEDRGLAPVPPRTFDS